MNMDGALLRAAPRARVVLSFMVSCVQCGAGADALLEDDGQLVCMDCGAVVGGLLSNEVAFGEHNAANMPSYHSQQRLARGIASPAG